MNHAGLYIEAITKLPPVPVRASPYVTTLSTTTDEDTTTFVGVDIGVPHPKRIIIVATHSTPGAGAVVTVDGVKCSLPRATGLFSIFYVSEPTQNTSATITFTATSALRKAISVFVAYPNDPIPIDTAVGIGTGTNNANALNVAAQNKGLVVYTGGQDTTPASSFTVTWSGVDAVVEDVDATYDLASSYTMGHISITNSSDQDDIALTALLTGTKVVTVASWGPPPPNN